MSVAEVWGRIEGQDAARVHQEGDRWLFAIPQGTEGEIIAEFWATDDVGNTSYRSAILTIAEGSIKCIRWMHTDGICTMLKAERSIEMMPHICPIMEA